MDSVAVIKSIRSYLSTDATLRGYFGVASADEAMKRLVMKDGQYAQVTDFYGFPAVAFKLDDDASEAYVPTNDLLLSLHIVNKLANSNCMLTCIQIKDRVKQLLCNKSNSDNKHEAINAQGRSLGLDVKIRGIFWVSGLTYDDIEQGSERLHRINCLIKLIVGD